MLGLGDSHNHNLLALLQAMDIQKSRLAVDNLNIGHRQGLSRLAGGIGNFMLGTKVTKDRGRHAVIGGQDEGDAIGPGRFIDPKQIRLGHEGKAGHHNSGKGTASAQYILTKDVLVGNTIIGRVDIHPTEGIETAQLRQGGIGPSHAAGHVRIGYIKVGAPIGRAARRRIPDLHPTEIGEDEILGRLDANSTAPDDQDVQILESGDGIAAECCLLTIDALGLMIDSIANLPAVHVTRGSEKTRYIN